MLILDISVIKFIKLLIETLVLYLIFLIYITKLRTKTP
jgi:hypothetical protein